MTDPKPWKCPVCGCSLAPEVRECRHELAIANDPSLKQASDFDAGYLAPDLGSGPMPDFFPN